MTNERLDRVKKHISDNRNLYIGGGIVLVTTIAILRSGNKSTVKRVEPYIKEFLKHNPQHADKNLRFAVVGKGQHLISLPMELMSKYKVGEKYDVIPTSAPVIYGPSLVIVSEIGKHLAVFPLVKGKL